MKKKFILFFFMLPLFLFVALIVYCYISTVVENNKQYYFPQIKTYLKVYKPPFNKYGYILFSKDSIFSFSKDIDFVKINKSETSWVSFIFSPLENNNLYIVDRFENIKEINQINFNIKKISKEDSLFFKNDNVAGIHTYILKHPYVEISVEGYLQLIFFTDYSIKEYPIRAEPIRGNVSD